ncbi:hypothetical protein PYCC9005_000502 [Savitreella phatthalungensis]
MSSLEPPSHSARFIDELIASDGPSSVDLESQSSSPYIPNRGQAWSTLDDASKERFLERDFREPSPEPTPPTSSTERLRLRRSRRRIANYLCLLLGVWAIFAVYLGWVSAGGFAGLQRESERVAAELSHAREVAANATKLAAFRLKHGLPMRNLTILMPGVRGPTIPGHPSTPTVDKSSSTTALPPPSQTSSATQTDDQADVTTPLPEWPADSWGGINGFLPAEIAAPIAGKLPPPHEGILSPSTPHPHV